MSDRDKKLLVYLAALLILAATYFLVGRPFLDKIDKLSTEKTQLESELAEKRKAYDNREMYEQGIVDAKNRINEIIEKFPEDNTDEKSIMFLVHAEKDVPIWFNQVKFAEETKTTINGQETESASDVEAAAEQEAVAAAEGEEAEGEAGDAAAPEGESSGGSTGIGDLMYRDTELGLSFQSQYDGFKNLLAYLRDYEDRMVIKELDVSYDKLSGMVAGTMVLSQYAILSPDRVLPEVVTDVTDIGTENVFQNSNHGGTILDLLAEIASDFINKLMGGLSEDAVDELGTDYFIKVNAVTDNTNGKTIGRADDVTESTFITSSSDGTEDVTFKVSGSGGTYSVYYKIGKVENTDSIEKTSDAKLYLRIASTSRMDADDTSAVNVHVINESDIPLVVNVEGDDREQPRVEIREQSGDVTVNGMN